MHGTIPAARKKLIEQIAASARHAQKRGDAVNAARFIRQYYRGVAEEDMAAYPRGDLAALALGHMRFAATRKRNRAAVRVFNCDPARDGWTSTHTIVEVVVEDMPFLVDSISMVLSQAGLTSQLMIHPIIRVSRDAAGRLRDIDDSSAPDGKFQGESWQHIEIDHIGDPQRLQQLEQKILRVIEDVRFAVEDWQAMRKQALAIAKEMDISSSVVPANEAREVAALLEWMEANHFTFLGYREYKLQRGRSEDLLVPITESGLGILRQRRGQRLQPTRLTGESREHAREAELLIITKANSVSTVHRATYLDYVGLKVFDKSGRVTGERRFLGLFTSGVYSRSPREIPLLRHKIERVVDHFGLDPASHDGKAVMHVLETYPRDELFQASVADIIRIVRGIVNLYERHRVRVFMRRDSFNRFYSGMIFVPRDRYNTQVRNRIEALVRQRMHATAIESQVQLSESALARVHMIVRLPAGGGPRVDVDALEQQITETVRTWDDRLREALALEHGEVEGFALADRLVGAFPAAYTEDVAAATAVADVAQIDEVLRNPERIVMRLTRGENQAIHLRLLRTASPIPLSRALPILENLGFTVLSERPYSITPPHATGPSREIWLQDFEMQRRESGKNDPAELEARFTQAFVVIWSGRAENDGFNRLIVSAGLTWRQAMVLRAYCRFLLQAGTTFSQAYMEQVLVSNPDITATLSAIFETQFDPAHSSQRRNADLTRLRKQLAKQLDSVTSLDEDRILRRYASAIAATLRTNHYQTDAAHPHSDGSIDKTYLSLKLDSRSIADLPQPRPAFEIFVYSPRVEGVHLRMGAVARGGLRWSDRREDFRTEVLGLMKAQNVKNTLIVPVGAKGGFVPKRLPANASREDTQREGIECYRTFIHALLDVTDNFVDGKVVPPARVVRRDGDDTYLVVAADKGTATFSDTANRIAIDYGFWLGDAFASGGSAGYDHKKMGITARGAWECVKRHFREIGVDIQSYGFTVAGIGDMAGDVFGNGMLLSRHIRLVAAFNHQHIFLDPNPDVATSFAERKRLFELPRSSWEDYNRKLLSAGGGIYPRSAKSIRISTPAQTMLGLDRDTLTPQELIRAILCMPVDLLWNGGIGTYVKASGETNLDVGDRANDAVRVNGRDLRCKVVGEGGNLGVSQRGRIEYALHGGRINTDFVDNSAGVDCSDHEVNIKILLNSLPKRAGLTLAKRNKLLVSMTEEVGALVLRDNYLQSQALSMLQARSVKDLLEHVHTIRSLELTGLLDRALEFLPSGEDIEERRKAGRGLTRPELAILLAYAKMALYTLLVDSDVPEDPYLGLELERYFPAKMQQRLGRYFQQHRLRREIIATATTNSMVNRMGASFARRTQEDTGASAATVVRAYAIARESFGMRDTWSAIEALDARIDASMQYEMMFETTRLLRFCTHWLIHRHSGALQIEQQVGRLRTALTRLDAALPRVLSGSDQHVFQRRLETYRTAKVPEVLSKRMASLAALRSGPDLVDISEQTRVPIEAAAAIYFYLGTSLSLDWLREQIESLGVEGHWQAVARSTLRDNIYDLQRKLCLQVLGKSSKAPSHATVDAWLAKKSTAIAHVRQTINDMRALPQMDFATLSVALQAVRSMAE
ncbi:NAD-glutamate dehydrogenase [Povalibacter sp.]|uniref:NAD-glutamate dehydrogenase n=1 Tax=Povalibacter sp. TaxID=1962978 RepID=UPI002F3EC7BA